MIVPPLINGRRFANFALCWLVLWLTFAGIVIVRPDGGQSPFFAGTSDLMRDFLNPMLYAAERDPYHNPVNGLWEKSHPPLFYVALYGIQRFCRALEPAGGGIYLLAAALTMALSAAALLLLIERHSALPPGKRLMMMAIFLGSGLFLYAFERGNLVLTAAALSGFFLFYYDAKEPLVRELALAALALAAGLKLAPAVFGLLLLYRRDFAGAARLALYGAAAIFLPFAALSGSLWDNLAALRLNMEENVAVYLAEGMRFGPTALVAPLQEALFRRGWEVPPEALYRVVAAVFLPLSALLALFAWRAPERWRQVLMLSLLPIFVPGNSSWYNALYLIPAFVLFFNAASFRRRDWLVIAAFLVLLSPLQLNGWTMAARNAAVLLLFAESFLTGLLDFRRHAARNS